MSFVEKQQIWRIYEPLLVLSTNILTFKAGHSRFTSWFDAVSFVKTYDVDQHIYSIVQCIVRTHDDVNYEGDSIARRYHHNLQHNKLLNAMGTFF